MANKQTSDRISSLAGAYGRVTGEYLRSAILDNPESAEKIAGDIRSMAASLRSQDEVKGLRKLWRKVTGAE